MKEGSYKTTFLGQEIPLTYVTDKTKAERVLSGFQSRGVRTYAIDTETSPFPKYKSVGGAGLSPYLSEVRLVQCYDGESCFVFDTRTLGDTGIFKQFLETQRFIGHNSVFDLQYFYKQFGISKCDIGCTSLAAVTVLQALDSKANRDWISLAYLIKTLFGVDLEKGMQTSCWSEPELTFEQVEYAALDAIATYALAERLAAKIKRLGLTRIYKLFRAAQHPIAKMQLNGLKLDVNAHRDMIVTWREKLYEAKKKLLSITGLKDITSTKIASYLQKTLDPGTLSIWNRTPSGKLSTDSNVFSDFDYLEIVKPFSEFQKLEKLCTAFGSNLIEQVNPETNRLHAQYKIAGARTGRLSCSQPNLQQLPREKSVRSNFIPGDNFIFLCADYSQIEIRVGAELSQDPTMLKAYKEGIDLHRLTASIISHKRIEDVTKEDRQKAKAFNFGLMFGLGAKKFSHYAKKSYGAEVSRSEAEEGVRTFRQTYSGYRSWQENQALLGSKQGYVITPCGKRRCLDAENSYGASMNTPIQGGAGECMLHALVRMDNIGLRLVNCEHDAVLVEVEPGRETFMGKVVEDCMIKGFLDVFPNGVTNKLVECKAGNNWAQCK